MLLLTARPIVAQEVLTPAAYSTQARTLQPKDASSASAVKLPFFDDFSNYQGIPDTTRWQSADAFVNSCYGPLPPTVGVVTLDAVDATGALHAGASTSLFTADTLASQPIRLDSLFTPTRRKLTPADSLYLSFYYLPGGGSGPLWERNGDTPEAADSLLLEFYMPDSDSWVPVWSTGGISVDTLLANTGKAWQYVNLPITDPAYFNSQFRFRFRNYCSLDNIPKPGLVGNCDHWNIDYVMLDYNRTFTDRYTRDVAFVNPAPSLLKKYQAMPARQFRALDMAQSLDITITNRYEQPLATHYGYKIYDAIGVELNTYDGGYENIPSYFPSQSYQTAPAHAEPAVNYAFPLSDEPQQYRIEHVVREGVSGDQHQQNDTITFTQVLDNYYAYDDGTAENGYGLTSTSSHVKLAYLFELNKADTLTAIDLYFNRTRGGENEQIMFYLCVWSDEDGHPGTLLYKDSQRRKPQFTTLNGYSRYLLEEPLIVSGKVYVGLEQTSNYYINLGFDRNNDARQQIYYLTSPTWQQSILAGALMMRPYFGQRATVGISHPAESLACRVYPNPVHDILNIDLPEGNYSLTLYNRQGSVMQVSHDQHQMHIGQLPAGLYLLRITQADTGLTRTLKIIKH